MELEVHNLKEVYNVYYRYRNITNQQKQFIYDLIKSLIHFFDSTIDIKENYDDKNLISRKLFEFPPTLDKEFIYLSCLFTLIKKFNNKKVIILVKGSEKINSMMNFCAQINNYYYKKNQKNNINYNPIKVIPFYSRKQLCYNYEALKKSNTFDMDTYCIRLNASFSSPQNNCKYYTNFKQGKKLSFNNEKDNIPFEYREMDEQMNLFFKNETCPFYYYLNNIEKNNYDIIICERDYFFDNKKNISIKKVIDFNNEENLNKYLLVLDEFNDLEDYLTKIYSCVIDKELLNFSEYQLFELIKQIQDMNINELPKGKSIILTPETEIIRYNLFYDMNNKYEFSGALRSNESITDWIKRLLMFFPDNFEMKDKKLSPFEFEKAFFETYNLDMNILEQLYKRLITLMNSMEYFDYDKIYHLIHFIFFICTIVKYNKNYFIINNIPIKNILDNKLIEKKANIKNHIFEYFLIKPNEIIFELKNNHHTLNLTGGLGEEKIVKAYYKFTELISYLDDNNFSVNFKTNLYLVNNTRTTSTDIRFYGEILKMLALSVPDGIICYFPNQVKLSYYTKRWMNDLVFNNVLNNKLIFIEENNSERLSEIIVNYKKTINNGRGAFLFLTLNNVNKTKFFDDFYGKYSRCVLFIGFNPKEMRIKAYKDQIYELKQNFNKISEINNEQIKFGQDTFSELDIFEYVKLFSSKITNKIMDINDKTILIILEEENKKFFLSDKYKKYLPTWLKNMIHIEKDDERNNINEKIKLIPEFLSLNYEK